MAEMYLSEKLAEQQVLEGDVDDDDCTSSFPFNSSTHFSLTSKCNSSFNFFRNAPELSFDNVLGRDNHGTRDNATYSAITKQLDVEELEMLLEAYFV
ncbi:Magnesium transporter MRS2-3 [Glycine soja]|uniref:Magnesium transporter MRS2-3 n=1 Tax=Glycine soja TaxID=3848 RepID=A0A0B2PN76_GLYSO|nr:Magnesium transporter MRS2-3 [Glycine soja]